MSDQTCITADVAPAEDAHTRAPTATDDTSTSMSRNASSPSSSFYLWDLVLEYKDLKERQKYLMDGLGEDASSSGGSDISQLSLVREQLETLGQLDTQAADCRSPAGFMSKLEKVEIPNIEAVHTANEVRACVNTLAQRLESCLASEEPPVKNPSPPPPATFGRCPETIMPTSSEDPASRPNVAAAHNIISFSRRIMKIQTPRPLFDLAWTPEGDILASVGGKLELYDVTGQKKPVPFDTSCSDGTVMSVAVDQRSGKVVWIAGYTRLHVTDLSARQESSSKYNLPVDCRRVRFTSDGNIVVGGHKHLVKFDINGMKIWMKDVKCRTQYLATAPDGRIIIIDSGCIYTYDSNGNQLPAALPFQDLLRCPSGICLDSAGCMYLADAARHSIVLLNPEGQIVREVVSVSKPAAHTDLFQDRYLCVGGDSVLGPNGIEVYDIN